MAREAKRTCAVQKQPRPVFYVVNITLKLNRVVVGMICAIFILWILCLTFFCIIFAYNQSLIDNGILRRAHSKFSSNYYRFSKDDIPEDLLEEILSLLKKSEVIDKGKTPHINLGEPQEAAGTRSRKKRSLVEPNENQNRKGVVSVAKNLLRHGRRRGRSRRTHNAGNSTVGHKMSAMHFVGYPPGLRNLGRDGVYRYWKPQNWCASSPCGHSSLISFNERSGEATIREQGLYFVYSQVLFITFNNAAQRNSYTIYVKTGQKSKRQLMQCFQSVGWVPVGEKNDRDNAEYHTCFMGGVTVLNYGDRLFLQNNYANRTVDFREHTSYWGIFKLG